MLSIDEYKCMTAPALCVDPFFQEWVFHPLGSGREFWLDLLISKSKLSVQMHLAQRKLLQYSIQCAFIAQAIEEYTRTKEELVGNTCSEICYGITTKYWDRLKECLITFEFDKPIYEIQFFKVIKPLFTSEREYFSFLHHAEIFARSEDENKFWLRQPLRLEKFKRGNANFYKAYVTGDESRDEWWYCRGEFRDQTSCDNLVATYLGMVRYLNYVDQQLKKMESS